MLQICNPGLERVLNATEYDESGVESRLSERQIPSNVGNEYSESETLN